MESPTAGVQETKRSVDVGPSLSAAERETTVTITDAEQLGGAMTEQLASLFADESTSRSAGRRRAG